MPFHKLQLISSSTHAVPLCTYSINPKAWKMVTRPLFDPALFWGRNQTDHLPAECQFYLNMRWLLSRFLQAGKHVSLSLVAIKPRSRSKLQLRPANRPSGQLENCAGIHYVIPRCAVQTHSHTSISIIFLSTIPPRHYTRPDGSRSSFLLSLFLANLMMGMVDQERLVEVTSEIPNWNALRIGYGNLWPRSAKSTWDDRWLRSPVRKIGMYERWLRHFYLFLQRRHEWPRHITTR